MTVLALNYAPVARPFVPRDFSVPERLEHTDFQLRMLTVRDVLADFEAVSSSTGELLQRFGPGWPEGLTLEQNLIDLGWHQKEFQRRSSFAYTVVPPGGEPRVLGCVYIDPTDKPGYDAVVRYWVRSSELHTGLERVLGLVLQDWLEEAWPFVNAQLYPRP